MNDPDDIWGKHIPNKQKTVCRFSVWEHQAGQRGRGEVNVWGILRDEGEIIQGLLGYVKTLDFIQCDMGNL